MGFGHNGFVRRQVVTVVGALVAGFLFAACSSGSGRSAATTRPSSTTSSPVSAQAEGCLSSQLSASAYQGSGAGGHEAVVVVLTNTSSTTCTLHGYPITAWFIDADGTRLGAVVTQQVAPSPVTVTLTPRQRASTTVWTDNPGVPSPSYCNPVTASAVAVEATSDGIPLTAMVDIAVCSTNNDIGTTPITPGSGESPM